MKGLIKACSGGSAMWRKWLTKRFYVEECAGSCSVGRPRKIWVDTMKEYSKKKRFGCRVSKENGV